MMNRTLRGPLRARIRRQTRKHTGSDWQRMHAGQRCGPHKNDVAKAYGHKRRTAGLDDRTCIDLINFAEQVVIV